MNRREHPAARGFARWLDERDFEHEAPDVDGGQSLGALWRLFVTEREAGVVHVSAHTLVRSATLC